jgi:hypothetical protein
MYPSRDGNSPVGKKPAWDAYSKLSPIEQAGIEKAIIAYKNKLGDRWPKDMVRFFTQEIWKEFDGNRYSPSWDINIWSGDHHACKIPSEWGDSPISIPLGKLRAICTQEQYRYICYGKLRSALGSLNGNASAEQVDVAWKAIVKKELAG